MIKFFSMVLKSKPSKGFTLIELLVTIIIFGVIIAAAIRGFGSNQPGVDYHAQAVASLEAYAAQAGLTAVGCMKNDTNYNGHISCDAKNPETQVIVALECGIGRNAGFCKTRLPGEDRD